MVFQVINYFNPFFYMIDGFRYAIIGYSDSSPWLGATVLIITNIVLWALSYSMIRRGYRLKG
jgi:ABC-2 type transport system permease protein